MGSRIRRHVGANAVGYVALIVAVVGMPTAWAIGRNTVGSKQIKPKAVRTSDLANNAVKSTKVKDGSLFIQDMAPGLDADTVDDHHAECAEGTFFADGFCFDSLPDGPTTWSSARDDCSGGSGYLPSVAQLHSIRNLPLINLGADAESAHWTNDVGEDDDGTGISVLRVQDSGGTSANSDPTVTQQPYRCAYDLVR